MQSKEREVGLEEGEEALDRERQEWQQQNKIVNAVTENWDNDSIDTCIRNNLVNKTFCERLFVCVSVCVCVLVLLFCVHMCMQVGKFDTECSLGDSMQAATAPFLTQAATREGPRGHRRTQGDKHPPQGKSCHRGQGENPTSGWVGPRRQAPRPRPQHPTARPIPPKTGHINTTPPRSCHFCRI